MVGGQVAWAHETLECTAKKFGGDIATSSCISQVKNTLI